MKHLLILLLAIITIKNTAQTNEEFRSTWVITWDHINRFQTAEQNKANVRAILDNHVKANMNAVLWQVRQSGTAYYNSSYEPWGYYAGHQYPGYDPLAYAVEEAHKRGLELHAWFNVFHVASNQPGTIAYEHPEWINTNEDGEYMTSYKSASPGLAAVREYTINVAMEIVRNYDIDGLHLDYVRWNEYDEDDMSNNKSAIEQISLMDGQFINEKIAEGKNIEGTKRYIYDAEHPASGGIPSGFSSWADWRRASVTEFVGTLHDSIQAVKPWVRLTPAALGKYKLGGTNGWNGYYVVFQDAALWFNLGIVDQLTPMHYHWTSGAAFLTELTTDWQPNIQQGIADGRLYSVGPGSYILDQNNLWYRHPEIVNSCRTLSWVDGFQFFSSGTWDDYDYWAEAGDMFFDRKTKVRPIVDAELPDVLSLSIQKIDSLNYDLTITPAPFLSEKQWFILYRSEDEIYDRDDDQIIRMILSNEETVIREDFDDATFYTGTYKYFVTAANRFWNESDISNIVESDSVSFSAPLPAAPNFISVTNINGSTLSIQCEETEFAEKYVAYISTDGITFSDSAESLSSQITVSGLQENQVYYFKVKAKNTRGSSNFINRIFAGVPSSSAHKVLVVNGFDRATNTRFDYIKKYADPLNENGFPFSYVLNDAVINDQVSINDYETVVWFLGDESTADETFNSTEKSKVMSFLQNGGNLFVSGAEIGWDLGRTGSSTIADISFYNNFLKAEYVKDAPGDQSGTYYTVEANAGSIFSGMDPFLFDDGTHGTIDVDWPDAINGVNGGINSLTYSGAPSTSNNAAVVYQGTFPNSSTAGAMVYFAFPFETVYPQSVRIELMSKILDYFYLPLSIDDSGSKPADYYLSQNFPNPFNPSTIIQYSVPKSGYVTLKVYDVLGKEVAVLVDGFINSGSHQVRFDAQSLSRPISSGVYFYTLKAGEFSTTKKLMLQK
jgi:uncharacterized lipoprotein YddW (UPF0748 family)